MEPDSRPRPLDAVERAHLVEPGDASHRIHRYDASDLDVAPLVRRFWIPVWSVPAGTEAPQRVLQYPVALLVVSGDYARFYGVVRGLSTTTLRGDGWAVGVMCTPAAGALVAGTSMATYTDRFVDLAEVLGEAGTGLAAAVRAAMAPDPDDGRAHAAAMAAFTGVLRSYLPVDEEGRLVDRMVAAVEDDPALVRVSQLCERFGISERSLQRLLARRLGLTPKWLIQRRRLQEASERLRRGDASLAGIADELGYADQAHFSRDFSRVTGTTPGAFAARFASRPG